MNIIQGLNISGFKLTTKANYQSLIGLVNHVTSDRNILYGTVYPQEIASITTVDPFSSVYLNSGVSSIQNVLNYANGMIRTKNRSDLPSKNGGQLIANDFDQRFSFTSHALNPFCIALIEKHNVINGNMVNNNSLISFGRFGAGYSSVGLSINPDNVNSRYSPLLRFSQNGSVSYQILTTNALNPLPSNQVNSLVYVFRGNGVANNHQFYCNESLSSQHTLDILGQNLVSDRSTYNLVQNVQDVELYQGDNVVYNWNSLTQPQIDNQIAQLLPIVAERRAYFQSLAA